ncbi:MAG: sulfide/dihydroorotate dehydrogenase-like FAD/NAD-binding protein [Clostridiales bacterium]
MFKIISKEDLGNKVYGFVVEAPRIAAKAEPGQFFIVRQGEGYERIPLTIADFDREKQTITMVFQAVGASTLALAKLEPGDEVTDMVGPLGQPSEIENLGKVVVVGGGVGVAPIYPIARALKAAGNEVISIIGARSKDLLFWEDRMREASSRLLVATDDGSYGQKGFVTTLLEDLLKTEDIARVWAIGPMVMMRAVTNLTRPYGTKTIVSMNPIMVDGTGMCGACRVAVDGQTKFACVDGPEFDGHAIDFDLAMKRAAMFKDKEKEAMEALEAKLNGGGCQCQNK